MTKKFIYFEHQEGGMADYHISDPEQLPSRITKLPEDRKLLVWFQTAEVGDYMSHRIGVAVRVKDIT